jgi:hypothetical protein
MSQPKPNEPDPNKIPGDRNIGTAIVPPLPPDDNKIPGSDRSID